MRREQPLRRHKILKLFVHVLAVCVGTREGGGGRGNNRGRRKEGVYTPVGLHKEKEEGRFPLLSSIGVPLTLLFRRPWRVFALTKDRTPIGLRD